MNNLYSVLRSPTSVFYGNGDGKKGNLNNKTKKKGEITIEPYKSTYCVVHWSMSQKIELPQNLL